MRKKKDAKMGSLGRSSRMGAEMWAEWDALVTRSHVNDSTMAV